MNKYEIELLGNIWIKKNGKNFIGRGRIQLLEEIGKTGSIAQAARNMKMSYKAAWDTVDIINKLAAEKIVTKKYGGKGGGQTKLTKYGYELITLFKEIENSHNSFLKQICKKLQL